MTHVMIDLETLGLSSQPPLLQISAASFDLTGRGTLSEFNMHVDPQSCVDIGARIEWGTVEWWLKQSPEAQKVVVNADRSKINFALSELFLWARNQKAKFAWSHGLSFDIPIVAAYARRLNLREPWNFKDNRDTRTLFDLSPVDPWADTKKITGAAHDAMVDVRRQVEAVQTAWCAVKGIERKA